ncbi:hypothetical protein DFH06DRAFT_1352076 [Mycena polygramma]|nr:hypothetical protein DFH06DRAFT_1352076 [Mycena polygramma]
MSLSYPPHPYPSMSTPSFPSIRLLVPMPIPRTQNAPYFDERGVRDFLALILQHGSNAGVTDADALVTFIVRYSSDRVREVIQYIPELDDDTPNRTWAAAREQMLLLYGSFDEERRVCEQDLIEFCRTQSAKSPYRTKLEIEQYLRSFQLIAAPLLKQRDITVKQRDYYFVSGIPGAIKNWFISRVPESQRTRSNPICLTDSLEILYGHFDPDALFPDLWNELATVPEPAALITPPPPRTLSTSRPPLAISAPFYSSIPLLTLTPPAPQMSVSSTSSTPPVEIKSVSAPASSTSLLRVPVPDVTSSPQIDEISLDSDSDTDDADDEQDEYDAQEDLEVSPSREELLEVELHQGLTYYGSRETVDQWHEGRPVYFCATNQATDHMFESECLAEHATTQIPTYQREELRFSPEPTHKPDVDISSEINAALERYLAGEYSELSPFEHSDDTDSGDDTGSDVESLFDPVNDSSDTDEQSSCSESREYNGTLATGIDLRRHLPSHDVEFHEPANPHRSHGSSTNLVPQPLAFNTHAQVLESSDEPEPDVDAIYDLYADRELSFSAFSLHFLHPEFESVTESFIELFQRDRKYSELRERCSTYSRLNHCHSVDERDLDIIYDLYSSAHHTELSLLPPTIYYFADSEPDSITDLFLEILSSEETPEQVDFTRLVPTREYDSSAFYNTSFDEDMRTIFELYTEQPEQPSQTEPFKRAEYQPFFLRTSDVHDYVSETLGSRAKSLATIEPTDDPPSYEDLVFCPELSFAFARPRIRAESSHNLFSHLFSITLHVLLAIFHCFSSLALFFITALRADHNFETIEPRDSTSGHELHGLLPHRKNVRTLLKPSYTVSMLDEPRPSDKPFRFIPLHPSAYPTFYVPPLIPSFCSDFEGEIESIPLCGRVIWLPRRQTPSHGFGARSWIEPPHRQYFISHSHSFLIAFFTTTYTFLRIFLTDLLYGSTYIFSLIPRTSRHKQHSNHNITTTRKTPDIEHFDIVTHSFTYLCYSPQTFCAFHYVSPRRRVELEFSVFSDYAGDRADGGLGTHSSTSWGDVLSLLRLCVTPGLPVGRRFCS